jgi:hypothetical protein
MPFVSLGLFMMEKHSRLRFRAHFGSAQECQYQLSSFGIPISAFPVSPQGEINLENQQAFMAMQRRIEATKSKGKGPLGVAQKAKKTPEEKARSRQPIAIEDVLVAAPQPDLNEPNWYGGLMSFSNVGDLPHPSVAIPWWRSVVGAPTLPLVVPTERKLPVVPHQLHITEPTIAGRPPPAKLYKSPAKPDVICDPLPNDILFGRGIPIQQRPGNVRFREMIDTYKDKYEQSEKGAKVAVSAYIVHLVKEEGGRFLKKLEDGRSWVEVDEATARVKVNNAFRTRRRAHQGL